MTAERMLCQREAISKEQSDRNIRIIYIEFNPHTYIIISRGNRVIWFFAAKDLDAAYIILWKGSDDLSNSKDLEEIKYLSDYKEAFRSVKAGEPLYLNENGAKRYVVSDAEEYDKIKTLLVLMTKIAQDEEHSNKAVWKPVLALEKSLGL